MEHSKKFKVLILFALSITLASKAKSLPVFNSSLQEFDDALTKDKIISWKSNPASETTSTINFLTNNFNQQVRHDT